MKTLRNISAVVFSFFLSLKPAFAQDAPPRLSDIASTFSGVLSYLFPIAMILCVIFMVYGGYLWIMSAGDPGRISQAQKTLTWAIIGLVFTLLASAVISSLLGAFA